MIIFTITQNSRIILQDIWRRVVGNVLINISPSNKTEGNANILETRRGGGGRALRYRGGGGGSRVTHFAE